MLKENHAYSDLQNAYLKLKNVFLTKEAQEVEAIFHSLSNLESDFESGYYMTPEEHKNKKEKLLRAAKEHMILLAEHTKIKLDLIEREIEKII